MAVYVSRGRSRDKSKAVSLPADREAASVSVGIDSIGIPNPDFDACTSYAEMTSEVYPHTI